VSEQNLCTTHDSDAFDSFLVLRRFAELKCSPEKAKKPHHKPHTAREFAEKYLQGYYSLVEDPGRREAAEEAPAPAHK
jgi:hypothetical protein